MRDFPFADDHGYIHKKYESFWLLHRKFQSFFLCFAVLLFEGVMPISPSLTYSVALQADIALQQLCLHWHGCSWLVSGKICMDLIAGVKFTCFIYNSRIKEKDAVVQEIQLAWDSEHRNSSPIFCKRLLQSFCNAATNSFSPFLAWKWNHQLLFHCLLYPIYFGGNLGQQGWVSAFELVIIVLFSQEEEAYLLASNSYLKWDT